MNLFDENAGGEPAVETVLGRLREASMQITPPASLDGVAMAGRAVKTVRRRRVAAAVGGGVAGVLILAAGAFVATGQPLAERAVLPGQPSSDTETSSDSEQSQGLARSPLTGESEEELSSYERERLAARRDACPQVAFPVAAGQGLGPEILGWAGAFEHAATRPDVKITESPQVEAHSIGCRTWVHAGLFADPEWDRAMYIDAMPAEGSSDGSRPVRGTRGRMHEVDGVVTVLWTERDVRWATHAKGLTVAEVLAIVDGLTIVSPTEVTAPAEMPVPGMRQIDVPRYDVDELRYTWSLYQEVDQSGGTAPYLRVTWPVIAPVGIHAVDAAEGVEVVPFNGGFAVHRPLKRAGTFMWVEGEVEYMISDADADLEDFKRIARSIEPISLDDPRLAEFVE